MLVPVLVLARPRERTGGLVVDERAGCPRSVLAAGKRLPRLQPLETLRGLQSGKAHAFVFVGLSKWHVCTVCDERLWSGVVLQGGRVGATERVRCRHSHGEHRHGVSAAVR